MDNFTTPTLRAMLIDTIKWMGKNAGDTTFMMDKARIDKNNLRKAITARTFKVAPS